MNEADPRVQRTRKMLAEAFMALLAEQDFQAISVQDIAERATLNRTTFYAHFDDKYALMDHLIHEQFHQALARRLPNEAPFTQDNLRALVVVVCEFVGQFHGHCTPNRLFEPRIEARVQQELYAFLLAWLPLTPPSEALGKVRREVAASAMSWTIFGAGIEWSLGERALSADEWARQVVAVMVAGVSQVFQVPVAALAPGH